MRDYGKVFSTFWTSDDTRVLSDDGKVLALYLLTGPHTNIIGCFRLPDGYVSEDLDWSYERVSKVFDELFRNGFATRDSGSKWVVIHKYLKWNPLENPNQAKAALKMFEQIPATSCVRHLIAKAFLEYGDKFIDENETVLKPFLNPSETVSKPGTGTGTGTGTEVNNSSYEESSSAGLTPPDSTAKKCEEVEPHKQERFAACEETEAKKQSEDDEEENKPGLPTCPQREIVALYHAKLPELSYMRTWEGDRQKNLRARWREVFARKKLATAADGLAYFGRLFDRVRESPFLMGQVNSRDRPPFQATLDWIVKPTNFAKIIDGRYSNVRQ